LIDATRSSLSVSAFLRIASLRLPTAITKAVKTQPMKRVNIIPQFAKVMIEARRSGESEMELSQFAVIIAAIGAMITIAFALGYSVGRNKN
jgi:hypothetical protein